jgi:hypothetical protein
MGECRLAVGHVANVPHKKAAGETASRTKYRSARAKRRTRSAVGVRGGGAESRPIQHVCGGLGPLALEGVGQAAAGVERGVGRFRLDEAA